MQELLAQSAFDQLKEGAIVPGTIIEIRQNEVLVDIGDKSEGVIPANEFIDIGELQIGATIDVLIEKLEDKDGSAVLSHEKAELKKNWDNILTICRRRRHHRQGQGHGQRRPDRQHRRRGLPAGLADRRASAEESRQFVGNTYEFKVVKINQERQNIVLSRRELIEAAAQRQAPQAARPK